MTPSGKTSQIDADSSRESDDERWMRVALQQAERAAAAGEVPVGAVVVMDGELLAAGFNNPISSCDATAHAEINALRAASKACENYRLPKATLYVTIEPCSMCAGAIVHGRLARLVFGAREPKAGAVVSQGRFFEAAFLNHRPQVLEGVLADQCAAMMQEFFRARRQGWKSPE